MENQQLWEESNHKQLLGRHILMTIALCNRLHYVHIQTFIKIPIKLIESLIRPSDWTLPKEPGVEVVVRDFFLTVILCAFKCE